MALTFQYQERGKRRGGRATGSFSVESQAAYGGGGERESGLEHERCGTYFQSLILQGRRQAGRKRKKGIRGDWADRWLST